MADSRTKNSFRNYGMTVISQVISILSNFIGRTFFIKLLSIEYLGINGLFSNILSLLSLAELGVGTAITYMMYKPIANHDVKKVAAYNNLFRKIYNWVGLFVLVTGICLAPFIYNFIKEPPKIAENLYIIYILYVLNSSISYFFTYKRSLLIGYQKEYINSQNVVLFAIIQNVVLIGLLFIFKNFYIYLGAQIVITFAANASISIKANNLFQEIVDMKPEKLSSEEIKTIIKNSAAMVCHKVGSVVVSGTGNIFISYYVGIATVGVYSNYVLISSYARQIIGQGINSLTASFGNLVAISDKNSIYNVFKKIYFLNFIMAYFISILFYALIDPFVTLWIGSEYLLNAQSILIIVVNSIFLYQIRVPSQMVINSYGLFWQIKWKSLVEAGINIIFSFLFAAYFKLGILGILSAGLISCVTTSLWWEPYVAFKYGLKQSLKGYFFEFVRNFLILSFSIIILKYIFQIIDAYIYSLILKMIIRIGITCILMTFAIVSMYYKTKEFKYSMDLLLMLFHKILNKK